jgi:hypothetical protein
MKENIVHALSEIEQQIIAAEERLRLAMLASDYHTLDELISPDLIFTNHLGQVFRKQDDLHLHRSGIIKFETLEPSERRVNAGLGLCVVSVRMNVAGTYGESAFRVDLRYTRIWCSVRDGSWKILAGHSSTVA